MTKSIFQNQKIIKSEGQKIKILELIDQGLSGDVYKVLLQKRIMALKVFFPYYQRSLFASSTSILIASMKESIEFQKREFKFLSNLSHPNIVKVFNSLHINLNEKEKKRINLPDVETLPAILMEWIDGKTFKQAINEFSFTAEQISTILFQIACALDYLHSIHNYMHSDIKSKNILIRDSSFEAVLIDFALCKNLNFEEVDPNEKTKLLGDWDLFPKLQADHPLKKMHETDGTRKQLKELSFPYLDLFQFGLLLKDLQDIFNVKFTDRESKYIITLSNQLTDWDILSRWDTKDLVSRISRLKPEHFSVFGIPELTSPTVTEKTIMLPNGISFPLTDYIDKIITNRSFRRLFYIHQLCLLNYVYPAADYKRVVHIFYSYELTRQLVSQLYSSSLFRVLFDQKSVRQLLVCSLLHDINHFPFLHIFQESVIPNLDKIEILDLFCNGEATGEKAIGKPSLYELLNDIGIDSNRFKRLVFGKHHEQEGSNIEIDQTINSILNSGVDIDKLSYLYLDGYFTGVSYGIGIDFPCILKAATVSRLSNNSLHLSFSERAIQALENVVMTRFWNFKSIYWHHTNRALMAMLLYVIRKIYDDGKEDVKEYLLQTMWLNDYEALRYLNQRYLLMYGKHSILNDILQDREKLFKRIYTVRAGLGEQSEEDIFNNLRKLTFANEELFKNNFSQALCEFLSTPNNSIKIYPEEILLDVPKRDIDSGGSVYISPVIGEAFLLINVSNPIRSINDNYERLTKRARIFVSPRIANIMGKRFRFVQRNDLEKLIKTCLNKTFGASEVQ